MTPDSNKADWWKVNARFEEALDLPDGERAAFLEQLAEREPEIKTKVERLLKAHADSESFLENPSEWIAGPEVSISEALLDPDIDENADVGPYRLLKEIGRGGMGTVYLAERVDGQFSQRVALKLIKGGFVTEQAVQRFRLEREILARLDHPNIARLIDGNVTARGWPYYVMEFVEGKPITTYCNDRGLSIRDRLELFEEVCRTVHYAHQNLIIHRDLTPNNVMVTDSGSVKLLDFGIAKLLDDEEAGVTIPITVDGHRLMTPEYASPEQVRGEAVTTVSDVYQLGVLLFELLSGRRPFELPSRAIHDIARVICEQDPSRPSTASPEASSDLAGDIDNIVLMALDKDPPRRYASAERFAEDVRRHLNGFPVRARTESFSYRAAKFVTRNKVAVVAAAVVVASVVGGFGVALWQATIAAEQRDAARVEAQKARQVTDFLVSVFEEADPAKSRGDTLIAHEILDRGAQRIDRELSAQPTVRATLLDAMGRAYQNLGSYGVAEDMLSEALHIRRRHLPADDPEWSRSLIHLAHLYLDREDLARVDSLIVLWEYERPPAAALTRESIDIERLRGTRAFFQNDFAAADSILRQVLTMQEELLGGEHADIALTLGDIGFAAHATGDYDRAEAYYRRSIGMRRSVQGEMHPETAITLSNLGWMLNARGEHERADSVLRDVLEMRRKLYDDEHDYVARSLVAVAQVQIQVEDYGGAEANLREAIRIFRATPSGDAGRVGRALASLGNVLAATGELDAAISTLEEGLAIAESQNLIALIKNDLGSVHRRAGNLVTAEALHRESLGVYESVFGPNHPNTAIVAGNLATALAELGRVEEAEQLYERALADLRATLPDDHPSVQTISTQLDSLRSQR